MQSEPRGVLEETDFEPFYRAHVARHCNAMNRWLVFIFDHVLLGSLLLTLRRPRAGLSVYIGAFSVLVLGHALLERNLRAELDALLSDPLRSLRAERRFLVSMWRTGPAAFDPALD